MIAEPEFIMAMFVVFVFGYTLRFVIENDNKKAHLKNTRSAEHDSPKAPLSATEGKL